MPNSVDKKFIMSMQWKEYVLFEWLLDLFHKNWWNSIQTTVISYDPFIVKATVQWDNGSYEAIWDADENNVNKYIVKHVYRMAETRAIARALRLYNNIWMTSAEELWWDAEKQENEKTQEKNEIKERINQEQVDNIKAKIMQNWWLYDKQWNKYDTAKQYQAEMMKHNIWMKNAFVEDIQSLLDNIQKWQ